MTSPSPTLPQRQRERRVALGNLFQDIPQDKVAQFLSTYNEIGEQRVTSEEVKKSPRLRRRQALGNLFDPNQRYNAVSKKRRREGVPDVWFGLPREAIEGILGRSMGNPNHKSSTASEDWSLSGTENSSFEDDDEVFGCRPQDRRRKNAVCSWNLEIAPRISRSSTPVISD